MFKKWGLTSLCFCLAAYSWAQDSGQIKGRVVTDVGRQPNVAVTIKGTGANSSFSSVFVTDDNGEFYTGRMPVGQYNILFKSPGFEAHEENNVPVQAGQVTQVSVKLQLPVNVMEVMTIASASRAPERIVDAPAAVSVVTEREIEAGVSHGQLPRILENTAGMEITQSGVYDFNINARGFNSSLNRRILTLIDGRDPAVALLGNQEWSVLSTSMEEISHMEVVRGPGSALYGANAFNGVLNIKTKRPWDSLGGSINLSGGELDTRRVDIRHAGTLGVAWAYKITGGAFASDTFSESRTAADFVQNGGFEYPGLPGELAPLDESDVEGHYMSLRLDRDFIDGSALSIELGSAQSENGLALTGIGRVQVDESERPWARINYNTRHWNFMYWRSERNTPIGQTQLNSGNKLWEDSYSHQLEVQFNYNFNDDAIKLVGGASYKEQEVDTANELGFQTVTITDREEDFTGVFAQATFKLGSRVDLVTAGRFDDSSLHDSQFSPKLAVVWKVNNENSLRFTYNEAFQTPNYSEFFLFAPAGIATPLAQLQAGLEAAVGGPLPLGFENVPIIAVGNPNLEVEENETIEVGYKGILGGSFFLTVDLYRSTLTNFVTDLLPVVNTNILSTLNDPSVLARLGDPNGQITPYQVPGFLPPPLQGALAQQLAMAGLDRNALFTTSQGRHLLGISYVNSGEVELDGADVALNYYVNNNWTLNANWSVFDFEIVEALAGESISPNSSDNKYNVGVDYSSEKWGFNMKWRHVDGFHWASGVFEGPVPDYDVVNIGGRFQATERWRIALNVNNAFDDEHYEIFGGSVLERRATLNVNFSW